MDSNDILMWVMVGLFVFLIVFILLLGWLYPGSGAEQLNWRPTRSPEVEAENEVDDITQMLEAANARRRRKGLDDLTEDALSERVRAHQREMDEFRARQAPEGDLDAEMLSMLEARNARRRKRGLPDMTLDELKASLGTPDPPERA